MNGWYERFREAGFWLCAPARRQPLRAAVLNTGELVLIDGNGNAQILSVETTDVVRDVLDASDTMQRFLGTYGVDLAGAAGDSTAVMKVGSPSAAESACSKPNRRGI